MNAANGLVLKYMTCSSVSVIMMLNISPHYDLIITGRESISISPAFGSKWHADVVFEDEA
jgi:hypothetical protein